MKDILNELAELFEGNIKKELNKPYQSLAYNGQPKTVGGNPVPRSKKYASGTLYNNVKVKFEESPTGDGLAMVLDFGPAESYAYFVEYGRRPGKFPPLNVLDRWLVQKGFSGIRDKQGRFISRKTAKFLVGRSIAEHGFKGINFVEHALEASMSDVVKKYGEAAEQFILDYLEKTGLFAQYYGSTESKRINGAPNPNYNPQQFRIKLL